MINIYIYIILLDSWLLLGEKEKIDKQEGDEEGKVCIVEDDEGGNE